MPLLVEPFRFEVETSESIRSTRHLFDAALRCLASRGLLRDGGEQRRPEHLARHRQNDRRVLQYLVRELGVDASRKNAWYRHRTEGWVVSMAAAKAAAGPWGNPRFCATAARLARLDASAYSRLAE